MKTRDWIRVSFDQNHMATTFRLSIACESNAVAAAESVLRDAHLSIERFERELTEFQTKYKDPSPVVRFNRARSGEKIQFTRSGIELLRISLDVYRKTQGAFSPFAKSEASFREQDIEILDSGIVVKKKDGLHLGFGAIGKGYALDCVRALVERAGFFDYCLDAGGSSLLINGFEAPGNPWKWAWGIEKDNEGNYLGKEYVHESGQSIGIGVSGFQEQGEHILFPRAWKKTKVGKNQKKDRPTSMLISHPSAAMADALSTAAFVMGSEAIQRLLDSELAEIGMANVDANGTMTWNDVFHSFSKLTGTIAIGILGSAAFATTQAAEEVNLEALDAGGVFNPYFFERNGWWVVLPLALLFILFLHLRKSKIRRIKYSRGARRG